MGPIPLLVLGISGFFGGCQAMMLGNFGATNMMGGQVTQGAFQQRYPGQLCELIKNPGLSYPTLHSRESHYGSKLISLNSYVCADNKYAEPYYKMEAVLLHETVDHRILEPEREPGVERAFGFHQNGFVLSRAKYYDLHKKLFNIYTSKYLKGSSSSSSSSHGSKPRPGESAHKPPNKVDVPIKDKKKPRDSSTSSRNKSKSRSPEKVVDNVKDKAKKRIKKLTERGTEVVNGAKRKAEEVKDKTRRKTERGTETARDGAKSVIEKAEEKASEAVEAVKDRTTRRKKRRHRSEEE